MDGLNETNCRWLGGRVRKTKQHGKCRRNVVTPAGKGWTIRSGNRAVTTVSRWAAHLQSKKEPVCSFPHLLQLVA